MHPGVPSLDQLQVFLTVVETGSFAAAGRKLGRATSAVSYTIANLEQQLGVQLFDRDRTRKPTLTAIGSSVLSEARTVSVGVDSLRAKISGMLGGLESELSIVVDVMLPAARVVDAMQAFEISDRRAASPYRGARSGDAARTFGRCQRGHQRPRT